MHVECRECGATLELAGAERTTTCAYCASPQVIERAPSADRPRPAFVLGFAVSRDGAQAALRRWYRGQAWSFRRGDLQRAPIERMQPVYVPAYLYSVAAHSRYSARIAEEYFVTTTYTTTVNGKTVVRTRVERRLEWCPISGQHATYLADLLVTASRGIANPELEGLEPFDLGALRRYGPEHVSGWLAEDASLSQSQCLELARGEARRNVGAMLAGFLPGVEQRDLQFQTLLEQEAIDLTLVPVWVLAVRYDPTKPPMRLLINGQTGRVVGRAPISWLKVVVFILVLCAVAGAIALRATM